MRPLPQKPGPGQESVWDYSRPPRVEPTSRRIRVLFGKEVIAETVRAFRVLETSHPPGYYIPLEDVRQEFLVPSRTSTFCEWKGQAIYHTLVVGDHRAEDAAWSYPRPTRGFEVIRDYLTFYPGRVDACYVDEEQVIPQPGGFYGGWITSDLAGPFKGGPGSWGW